MKLGTGSRIAFLADSHVHSFGEVEERLIGLVNDEKPDMIMVGGDTIDEFTTDMRAVAKYVSSLQAREKLAVMGNHD